MSPLTVDQIVKENQGQDISSVKSLKLNLRAISDVSFLCAFSNLEQLDVSCNNVSSLEGLSSCASLKNISVAQNKLTSLKGIQGLSKLAVLNAGQNMITSMNEVTSLTNLRALIMNDNKISSIPKLEPLKYLNTLVLSKNPIANIGKALENMKSITKLSLSNCQIHDIGSALVSCLDLKEARFAHNEITTLPNELSRNARLQVLDLGKNAICRWSDLRVLSTLQAMKNLNLQGNPVTEINNLLKKVKKMLPRLKTFNAKPLDNEKIGKMDKDTPSFEKDGLPDTKPVNPPDGEETMKGRNSTSVLKDNRGVGQSQFEAVKGNTKKKEWKKENSGDKTADEDMPSVEKGSSLKNPVNEKLVKRTKKQKVEGGGELDIDHKKKKKRKVEEGVVIDTIIPTNQKASDSPFSFADIKAREESKEKEKDKKKKQKKGISKSSEFDDGETPFMDLIVPEDASAEDLAVADKGLQASRAPKGKEEAFLGGLVIDLSKKKKKGNKAQNVLKGSSALELLQSVSEVGMGGPSTWD